MTAVAAQTEAGTADRGSPAAGRGRDQFLPGSLSTRLKFPYRLQDTALKWPFLVQGMCTTGSYLLRSNGSGIPGTLRDQRRQARAGAYDLTEDGLYVARHLLGDGWLQIGKEKGPVETGETGAWTMSTWKRIHEQATGALPVSMLSKWGAVLIALLLAAFLLSQSLFNSAPEEEVVVETGVDQPTGPGTQAQVTARIREEALRQEAQRQAAERALQRQQQLGVAPPGAAPGAPSSASIVPVPSGVLGADPIVPSSEAEAELREVLRLEEIERRRRSLRSAPVAQTYRAANANQPSPATVASPAAPQAAPAQVTQTYAPPPAVDQALQQSLDMLNSAVSELEAAAQTETLPVEHQGELPVPPGLGEAAEALTGPTRDYENPRARHRTRRPARLRCASMKAHSWRRCW